MTASPKRSTFAARPSSPDGWVRATDGAPDGATTPAPTARLTIDVTPELRGRIKVTAFQRGLTVADMLRALLAREYPVDTGDDAGGKP